MFGKCQMKSNPDYFLNEDSFIHFENLKPTLPNKKSDNTNSKRYSGNIFQPINHFIKENGIIKDFHLDLQKSCKLPKHQYTNNIMSERNYIETSYNNSNEIFIDKHPNRNKIISFNKKMDLDCQLDQTDWEIQRRALKSIKNQLDIQKSVNFNVLSYRPEDYDSNVNKSHIFHKLNRPYLPINRIQTPLSSRHLSERKEEKLLSYQQPTFKFQSFYGEQPDKIVNKAKSNSKIKNIHLDEYNIDKLIEIGDNYENKMIPILSFGKKVRNIKKRMKLKNSLIKNSSELVKNMQKISSIRDFDNKIKNNIINENEVKKGISQNKKMEIQNNGAIDKLNNSSTENDKKIYNAKKFVYHGQIKRKRNIINNAKTYINPQNNKMINMINRSNINNNDSNSISYKKYQIFKNNQIQKNSKEDNISKSYNSLSKIKKMNVKSNNIELNQKDNKYDESQHKIVQGITPKNYKRKMELSLNINENNNSFSNKNSNYNNLKNIMERNKSLNNYIVINGNENRENPELILRAQQQKGRLLTESEIMNNKFRGKNSANIDTSINSTILQKRPNIINPERNYGKKYIKNGNIINININGNNNNIQVNNKISKDISSKSKPYYGYDIYNVEGNIINHSYFESINSRKKSNLKNTSIGNIN